MIALLISLSLAVSTPAPDIWSFDQPVMEYRKDAVIHTVEIRKIGDHGHYVLVDGKQRSPVLVCSDAVSDEVILTILKKWALHHMPKGVKRTT